MEREPAAEKDTLVLQGTLTKKEFLKHGQYHMNKILNIVILLFLVFAFLNFVISSWNEEDLNNIPSYIVFALFSLVLSGLLMLVLKMITRVKTAREFKSDPLVKKEMRYIISSREIHQNVGRSDAYLEWEQIRTAHENKDMFRLYVSRGKAMVLPKRFFKSEAEMRVFRKLIRENLSRNRIKF
ncbi:YcxB family protein [Jeotgalibacillus sp. ET6]|uniref:YcxB family protein n=1 Tax=Jeotgalibacillus sp. ET6 TaxID=3037260 RepID=UPI002418364A|nr:YcxB family protein [Jeotgalibacillus sp. ET6]MDG5471269.1 YcxB family protein [Jeotgalibacillus sp. ET6]